MWRAPGARDAAHDAALGSEDRRVVVSLPIAPHLAPANAT